MTDAEKAARVIEALKAAEPKPPEVALKILNGLVGLVQGGDLIRARDAQHCAALLQFGGALIDNLFELYGGLLTFHQ